MKMKRLVLVVAMVGAMVFIPQVTPQTARAQGILSSFFGGGGSSKSSSGGNKCGDTDTQLVACDPDAKTGVGTISSLIKMTISVLTVLIGVVATGGIAYGAVLYASARDNQSQLDQSKTIIRNIIIGLFLYGFTIAIINWLIPGGVIGGGTPPPSTSPTTSPSPTSGLVPTE